ncbi:DUF418 domain-containing protein [Agromyces sp. LHK192]|uniref:DUF418 domain-containing protein n=1 Tax=Agromyces sp. LHK192 TaxID=2498704 RepID=UPI000FD75603|nr:DUF418 domain-containing protein [Agromyces sp. LHK192]
MTTSTTHPPASGAALGPTTVSERSIAPDLARGAMLLAIALANAPFSLWGAADGAFPVHAHDGSAADRIWQTVSIIAIDSRAYPMFAALFGYGIWQLYRRQTEAGVPEREVRRLLRRRHWWMLAFGLVHAALLWAGDIVGAYGLAGLVLTWLFLRRRDRTLAVWASVLAVVLTALAVGLLGLAFAANAAGVDASGSVPLDFLDTGVTESDYLVSMVDRVGSWIMVTLVQGLLSLSTPLVVLLAMLAARHRVLEEPLAHLRVLRAVAVAGVAIGWIGGAVVAAQHLGMLGLPADLEWGFHELQALTGVAGGLGYVAVFGLIAAALERRRALGRPLPVVARALQATGRRSLSAYLAQSVLMAPVLCAWGLGLGAVLTSWSVAVYAVVVWALTVAGSVWLERAGRQGPAERLLRRLAYGRTQQAAAGRGQTGVSRG